MPGVCVDLLKRSKTCTSTSPSYLTYTIYDYRMLTDLHLLFCYVVIFLMYTNWICYMVTFDSVFGIWYLVFGTMFLNLELESWKEH